MKKVFVIAMKCEAETVVSNLADVRAETLFGREVFHGTLNGKKTAVVVAGIGKVNAAASTQLAISSLGAEVVLNIGVAGGLDPKFNVGDKVISKSNPDGGVGTVIKSQYNKGWWYDVRMQGGTLNTPESDLEYAIKN